MKKFKVKIPDFFCENLTVCLVCIISRPHHWPSCKDLLHCKHYWSSIPFMCVWARVGLVAGRAEASEVEHVRAR